MFVLFLFVFDPFVQYLTFDSNINTILNTITLLVRCVNSFPTLMTMIVCLCLHDPPNPLFLSPTPSQKHHIEWLCVVKGPIQTLL